jgi:excisionase family DNA binding protein
VEHPSNPSPTQKLTVTIETLAAELGINRSTAYALARQDRLPVPVIRLGRRMVVSRQALDRLLATDIALSGQSFRDDA